jgi:predicted nucleic acid-binding protein
MGSLILPSSGPVYADAQIFIYSVEKHPIYAPTLRPLWEAVSRGDLEVLSSELTLMETLIGPLKQGDAALATDYENFCVSPGIRLLPITASILRAGARLRATLNKLRTPDAIQAATGHSCRCTLFLTNDFIFRRIPGLPVVLLDDLLRP